MSLLAIIGCSVGAVIIGYLAYKGAVALTKHLVRKVLGGYFEVASAVVKECYGSSAV